MYVLFGKYCRFVYILHYFVYQMHKHMHSVMHTMQVLTTIFVFSLSVWLERHSTKNHEMRRTPLLCHKKTIVYIYLFFFFLFLFIHYFLLFHYLLNNLFCFNFSHLKREMVIAGRLVGGMSGGWLVDMRAGDVLTCVTYKFKVSLPL